MDAGGRRAEHRRGVGRAGRRRPLRGGRMGRGFRARGDAHAHGPRGAGPAGEGRLRRRGAHGAAGRGADGARRRAPGRGSGVPRRPAAPLRRAGRDGAHRGGVAAERPPLHGDPGVRRRAGRGRGRGSRRRRVALRVDARAHRGARLPLSPRGPRADCRRRRAAAHHPHPGREPAACGSRGRLRGGAGAAGGAPSRPRPSRPRRGAGRRRRPHPRAARGGGRGDGEGARAAGRGAAQLLWTRAIRGARCRPPRACWPCARHWRTWTGWRPPDVPPSDGSPTARRGSF
jgi:hypothetical protein